MKQLLLLLALMTVGSISAQRGRAGMPAAQAQTQREWIGRGTTQGVSHEEQMPVVEGGLGAESTEEKTRQAMPGCDPSNPYGC